MHNYSTASLQHTWHDSFGNLKKFLSSHEDLFDDILEKATDVGIIILVAGLTYIVMLMLLTINNANHVYINEITNLTYNAVQGLMHYTIPGFI